MSDPSAQVEGEPRENPFLNPWLAARYEQWYSGDGLRADRLEKRLMRKWLHQLSDVRTVLEVGCGTGHFTGWFRKLGYEATGLDSSPAMLKQARRLDGGVYVHADALTLPFANESFDIAVLITTLEFAAKPTQALVEASRVSRSGLLLGVLNRHSTLVRGYRHSGKQFWRAASFYTPDELTHLVHKAVGLRVQNICWRTTLWPYPINFSLQLPWGGFIGMCVRLTK